jgi:hypothetical protein
MEDAYSAREELDFFIANPATADERDWQSLRSPGSR